MSRLLNLGYGLMIGTALLSSQGRADNYAEAMRQNLSLCAFQLHSSHQPIFLQIFDRVFDPEGPQMSAAKLAYKREHLDKIIDFNGFVDAIHRAFWTRLYRPYAVTRAEITKRRDEAPQQSQEARVDNRFKTGPRGGPIDLSRKV